jgi:hypothetical protein
VRAEFTLDGLVTAWPSLVAAARGRSRFLGEALGAARPVAVDPPEVKVAISDGSSMHAEALARQREALEGLIREAVGRPVRVVVLESSASSAPAAPRRLSDAEARAERLKVLRSRDPALETAAEVLDLEVLE